MKKIKYVILLCIILASPLHGMKRSADDTLADESHEQIYFTLEQLPTELLIAITEQAMPEQSPETHRLLAQIRMLAALRATCRTLRDRLPFNAFHTTFKRYSPDAFDIPEIIWKIVRMFDYDYFFEDDNPAAPWLEACLRGGANPNAENKYTGDEKYGEINLPKTAYTIRLLTLLGAATDTRDIQCMHILLNNGANPHSGYCPALCYASNKETIQLLIKNGANINQGDITRGKTALYRAAYDDNQEVVKALLQEGAEVNIQDKDGFTPLHHAWTKDCAQLLLDAGADPNIQNNIGETPLHWAAYSYIKEVAIALLQAGARKDILTDRGQTAAQIALDGEEDRSDDEESNKEEYENKLSTIIATWPITRSNK